MDKRKYEENNNKKSKKIWKFVNNNVSKDLQKNGMKYTIL